MELAGTPSANPARRARAAVAVASLLMTATAGATEVSEPAERSAPSPAPRTSHLEDVQVTASRFRQQVQDVPDSLAIVRDADIRARAAVDLRGALALVGGVEVVPGGDAGPAGAMPALLGSREADDFLLLVDGVPLGGAFAPPFEATALLDVERIEVLRGTAPVYFGTTAFAGTINLIHNAAGRASNGVEAIVGSFGSRSVAVSAPLADGVLRQSVSAQYTRQNDGDPRTGFDGGQGLYRLATDVGATTLRLDAALSLLRQRPGSPSPVDDSGQPTPLLAPGFNQNPSDARRDSDRYQLTLGADRAVGVMRLGSTLALAYTRTSTLAGFLDDGYADRGGANATGFAQARTLSEAFVDANLTASPAPAWWLTIGANELYGRAHQRSSSFAYGVPLEGTPPDAGAGQPVLGAVELTDRRNLAGVYAQASWTIAPRLTALGGVRWNLTDEARSASTADQALAVAQHNSRPSGSAGLSWRFWQDDEADLDAVVFHCSYGNTFQLPQADLGPGAGFDALLRPERQRSLSAGFKADGLDGRLDLDLAAFAVDFSNRPVTTAVGGLPTLAAGGRDRYRGVEIEGSWRISPALRLSASATRNDSRYVDFTTVADGATVQLAGRSLPLTARSAAAAGFALAPASGAQASVIARYTGQRYLDQQNAAPVGGFTTVDAMLGYAWRSLSVRLSIENLTDRRDPVALSELGEGQLYRLRGRRLLAQVRVAL
jgi:iron complex outermembrane recepter protein